MVKNVVSRVLIAAAQVDREALRVHLEKLVPVAELGERMFVMEGLPYIVNFKKFTGVVAKLADKLGHGQDVTVGDITNLDHVFEDADPEKFTAPRHHFYSPVLLHDPVNWPVKDVVPGVVLLVGDTKSGKTYHVEHKLRPDVVVRYSEPQEAIDRRNESVCPVSSLHAAITAAMTLSALGVNVAVDSLRGLIYSLRGNAMEGGMVATVFDVAVQLNNLFAEIGSTVVFAINPMLADPDKVDRLVVRLDAACAGTVLLAQRAVSKWSYRLIDRRIDSEDAGSTLTSGPGRMDPANTAGRADSTIYSLGAVKENPVRDSLAVTLGATSQETDANEVRTTPNFTL